MEVQCIGKGLRNMQLRVLHLDDTIHTFHLSVHATGLELYASMVERIHLLEADYFDLEFVNDDGMRCWLDHDKPILRQLSPGKDLIFRFGVKFYTPHPNLLEEEFTRYLFALQVKRDLVSGTLLCSENTAALLASYIVQAEIGDFIEDEYRSIDYLRSLKLLHEPSDVRLHRIMEFHKAHIGLSPTEADFALLDTARKVEFYGVRLHFARDNDGLGLNLAVTHLGVLVFQNLIRINTLSWAKIRKLSFKRRRFLLKLHAERYDSIEFIFDSRDECKLFWKNCIEHHTFFRCPVLQRDPQKRGSVASTGSSFKYTGRTQQELAEYVKRHGEYRIAFKRPSAARRANPNALTGLNYPSRRLNSASMQLRSSSVDRRSFLLNNMGASLSASTLGRQPALKRAQSMAAGALGGNDADGVASEADGPGVMTTSGYATMAGSAGSAQSADTKESGEQSRDWAEEQQQPENESQLDETHWSSESHRRMTGDWTGNGARLESTSDPGRRAKSATGSPRTSAAASLTQLNTQLDAFLQSQHTSTEPTGMEIAHMLTTTATIEQSIQDENSGPIYSQPTEESPSKKPDSLAQYTLVPVESTTTGHVSAEPSEVSSSLRYQEVADTIHLDIQKSIFSSTPTVTYSSATRTVMSTEPISQDNNQTSNQTGLIIAQPDVISQTDGFHAQAVAGGGRGTSSPSEPRTPGTSLTTFLTDAATPLRLDQSGQPTDYSVAAALIGSPVASSRLNRDPIPNMLGQFEFRAQDGLFILPTVTQFGLEINMDRQEARPVDSTRQTLFTEMQTTANEAAVYGVQTGSMMDTVMQWYTRPDPTSTASGTITTTAPLSYGAYAAVSTTDPSVDYSVLYPRSSVAPSTVEPVSYGMDGGFAQSTIQAIETRTAVSTSGTVTNETPVSITGGSRHAERGVLIGENYIASATPGQSVQVQSTIAETLPTGTTVDRWSSSGSDSTTGVILRPDLASSLSRITQHSTGCPHATPIQARHQSSQALPNTTVVSSETAMQSKSHSTPITSNTNNGPLAVLPLNTLPDRQTNRGKQPVHAHTCSRGRNLSQSIPCSVHLSGLVDAGPKTTGVSVPGLDSITSHPVSTPSNPSGAEKRRTKDSTDPEARRARRGIDSSSQQADVMPADMVLLNGINAATDMLEEVPYVVMRRPRSVDVKQYQLHLQRQQQQAAALAAAAAGYPLHPPGAHHAPMFPTGEQPYTYGSRVPMQPQIAYAPMLPSAAAYPGPGSSHSRERSGGTRKSGRRTGTGGSGLAGAGHPPPPMAAYPEAYYHGMRHGMMMMPFEGEGYPSVPPSQVPGPYMDRTKCKAKRKHSKSRAAGEKLEDSIEQNSRSSKPSSSHMAHSLMSPTSSIAMAHRGHLGQPQQHHMHCAHRPVDVTGEGPALSTGQPRPMVHSRRHVHSRPDMGGRQVGTETSSSVTAVTSVAMAPSRPTEGLHRPRRSTQTTSTAATKSDLSGERGKKFTTEADDGRELEVPYPVSELFISPSRTTQPDDIRISKGQPVRRHHHHHHHPACASLMGRVRAQIQRDTRQSDPTLIQSTGPDPRLGRTKTRTGTDAAVTSRATDKLDRPIQSSDVLDVVKSRDGALDQDRDTRETIEKLREELRSAGFQVKDSPHHKVPLGLSPSHEHSRYKTGQSTTKVAPVKKPLSKTTPKPTVSQARTATSSAQPEVIADRLKRSPGEQRTAEKVESATSSDRRPQTGLDTSFGGPPQNPIYLDSDSDSLEVTASQPKPKHRPLVAESQPSTSSITAAGSISVTSGPSTTTVAKVPSTITTSDSKFPEAEDGIRSPDIVNGEALMEEDHAVHDQMDDLVRYTQSPRSHSPSLPLSFPLSEFDGSEASIVSSDASSLASEASYYSNRSSVCNCFSSGSVSSATSCSYCHDHRRGHRSTHRHHGHYHPAHHHHHHRHHHPHHSDRHYYASLSRSACHCHRCLAAAAAPSPVEHGHYRRHQSDHRDSRRHRQRHESHPQKRDQRTHSERPHHIGSRHSYSHRSVTSSQHGSRHHRHHADDSHRRHGYRDASYSRTSSNGSSFGDRYSDYSNSEDSFDLGSSPAESPTEPMDETHQAMLIQLKQQERKLRNELAKHRALANQLKEAQKRTQKLLHSEQLPADDSTKRSADETGDRIKVETEEKSDKLKVDPVQRRTSRRRPRPDGSAKGERHGPGTPSTSRSSDRVHAMRKSSAGRKKKDAESKEKHISREPRSSTTVTTSSTNTIETKAEQSRPESASRKESHHHVLSEPHRRSAHRTAHASKRSAKPHSSTRMEGKSKPTDVKESKSTLESALEPGQDAIQSRKPDADAADESDTLVIANKAALSNADDEQPSGQTDQTDKTGSNKLLDVGKVPLETVQEVIVPAESQLIPVRKPWDEETTVADQPKREKVTTEASAMPTVSDTLPSPPPLSSSEATESTVKSSVVEFVSPGGLRSSFNRLTDLRDESTGENADEDSEYNGTRIFGILSSGVDRITDTTGEVTERLSQESVGDLGERSGVLTDGSATMSGGDETHTSEASVDTVKPAYPSREPSPTSSTTSASEGSEDIEPFPSPPPESALHDPYQGRTSPLSHSHLVISTELDEVIEEETGASEMEADAAAAAAAIAVLDAATMVGDEGEDEEEEEEETSNATVIARDPEASAVSSETANAESTEIIVRPTELPEPTAKSEDLDEDKTPTESQTPVGELVQSEVTIKLEGDAEQTDSIEPTDISDTFSQEYRGDEVHAEDDSGPTAECVDEQPVEQDENVKSESDAGDFPATEGNVESSEYTEPQKPIEEASCEEKLQSVETCQPETEDSEPCDQQTVVECGQATALEPTAEAQCTEEADEQQLAKDDEDEKTEVTQSQEPTNPVSSTEGYAEQPSSDVAVYVQAVSTDSTESSPQPSTEPPAVEHSTEQNVDDTTTN